MSTLAQTLLTRMVNDPRDCHSIADMLRAGWAHDAEQLHSLIDTLERRLFVVKHSRGCYQATADARAWIAAGREIRSGQGAKPRNRAAGLPARIWAWLRIHRKGTLADILTDVAQADQTAAETNAYRYLQALEAAGHVRRMRGGKGAMRWLLINDTGRAAPVHRRASGVLHDPNTGERHALETGHA